MSNAQMATILPALIGLPLVGAAINGLLGARLPRATVATIACGALAASFGLALCAWFTLAQLPAPAEFSSSAWPWLTGHALHVDLRLKLDPLSSMMTLIITGIGLLIHIYSWGYWGRDPGLGRYYSYLNLFCAAMLLLVLGDALPSLFIGWEGVGLCSYLLIGFTFVDPAHARAGRKAFVVNRIGDMGLLLAMFVLHRNLGTLDMAAINAQASASGVDGDVAFWACMLLALGVAGKSAQLPLYVWLPDAMAGPTPVSALIHAATMVTAGIYLMVRMGPLFVLAPAAQTAIACIGAATALFAATSAVAQTNIKRVLAYSTVSQLGYMVMACGLGAQALAMFHVTTHAFFKACLFLGAGAVIHSVAGEQDLRRMGGLARRLPITCVTFLCATLALSGVPPLAGFVSKDAILAHAFAVGAGGDPVGYICYGVGLVTALLTAFYMGRLFLLTFVSGAYRGPKQTFAHLHEAPFSMALALIVLAALSAVGGTLGWPHVLGGHMQLSHWLGALSSLSNAPLVDLTMSQDLALMAVSTLVAVCGLGTAWVCYGRAMPAAPLGVRAAFGDAMGQAWGVDAAYAAAVAGPYAALGRGLRAGIEQPIIAGSLAAVAYGVRALGAFLQLFHSGNIQRYLAIFALGVALLLYGWLLPGGAQAQFDSEPQTLSPKTAPHDDGARK